MTPSNKLSSCFARNPVHTYRNNKNNQLRCRSLPAGYQLAFRHTQYNREVLVDPDASMGTREMTLIHGNAKLDLHSLTGKLSWRMWAGTAEQLGNFIKEDIVEMFFGVFDDEMGYVGVGDVVYYDPSMSVATS